MSRRQAPTGLLFLSMGDPPSLNAVGPFLRELFTDREIMRIPFQDTLGPLIARARAGATRDTYREMGGGSPLAHWMDLQMAGTVARLDRLSPGTAPHRGYAAYRYTDPHTEEALLRMRADGVRRVVAFPQFPQYSCATSGSSLNEVARSIDRLGLQGVFQWSVLDRWYNHPAYVAALASAVTDGIDEFGVGARDDVLILFSAHSLPTSVINRGDPYPQAIGATVEEVMRKTCLRNPYALSYQSKVGPAPWQGPKTIAAIDGFAAKGVKRVLVVCVSFTSDHVETLAEIDIELAQTAERAGLELRRAPSLNTREDFIDALAEMVADHLASGEECSPQYLLPCLGCVNPTCGRLLRGSGEPIAAAVQPGPAVAGRAVTRTT